jgi:type IV pilus assembly protein PilM
VAGKNSSSLKVACEIGVERVIAARASQSGNAIEAYTSRRLPAGTIAPGLLSANVLNRDALLQSIEGALSTVDGGSKDIIAVLPDSAVRVLLLDFDTLPEKAQDAAAIIRFRLKKSLPFDVDHATLSYHATSSNGKGTSPVKVVAAVSPQEVIHEYEAIFREAGYSPGIVIPSILATLGLVDAVRPTMVVKVDALSTTVAIVDRQDLVLLRTLDHAPRAGLNARELTENVYPSITFFEDTYSSKIELVQLTGMAEIEGVASVLQSETGVRTEELESRSTADSLGDSIPDSMLAAVAGALVGDSG